MNRTLVCLLCSYFFVPCLNQARADSLWDRRDPYYAHMFYDLKARRVGDLLTINLREITVYDGRENRTMEKETTLRSIFRLMGDARGGSTSRSFDAGWNGSSTSQRELEGTADYRSNRSLTDRMAVQVVQVLPNGNLVIEGFRTRVVAQESRTMRISGIVRPPDIGANNTVESQFIANFTVQYLGQGAESSYLNNGWLGRFFNRIWPY